AQMIDQPNEQHGRDILFETLPGDPGAHGPYRERERGPDWQMRLRTHSRAVLAGSALLALGSLVLLRRT
ncbi:MAG: short-chain dehydrogenase, partial [Acidobacteria bacterium]|nr:short-chain dehydrogenase [Acidobacteriota bacterium]